MSLPHNARTNAVRQQNTFLNVTCTQKVSISRWTEECTPGFVLCMNACMKWKWVLNDNNSTCRELKSSLLMSVPGLLFAELRKSHDFQHNHFINAKMHN